MYSQALVDVLINTAAPLVGWTAAVIAAAILLKRRGARAERWLLIGASVKLFRALAQIDAFVKLLGDVHCAPSRPAQLACSVLLHCAGGERRLGAAAVLALRALAGRGADALASAGDAAGPEGASLAGELRSLAGESDPSVRLSDLAAANDRLHAAVGRLGILAQASDEPAVRELRSAAIARLREEAESRALYMLGPRADG